MSIRQKYREQVAIIFARGIEPGKRNGCSADGGDSHQPAYCAEDDYPFGVPCAPNWLHARQRADGLNRATRDVYFLEFAVLCTESKKPAVGRPEGRWSNAATTGHFRTRQRSRI